MNKPRFDEKSSNPGKTNKRFSKLTSFIILGVFTVALIGIGIFAFSESSKTVEASVNQNLKTKKNTLPLRKLVADPETGKLRKPNEKELKELVDSLYQL